MHRLFVGIAIPEDIQEAVSALQSKLTGARWIDPDNYHITLAFIGEIERPLAEDADHALAQIELPAFDLALHGVGCFGKGAQARALWVGVEDRSGQAALLARLQTKVANALRAAGVQLESRKFNPHVTVARLKQPEPRAIGQFMERHNLFRSRPFTVDSFSLFESHLRSDGAQYRALVDYPLAGAEAAL